MKRKLRAFPFGNKQKEDILKQLQEHYDADEIIKGQYWENGKGCAEGCTIHSCDHQMYETQLGIHATLAHLEDVIFEGLPNKLAKNWPIDFVSSINVGADLSLVFAKLYVRIATDQEHGFHKYTNDKRVHHVADLYQRMIDGNTVSSKKWDDAGDAARDATRDATRAAAGEVAWAAWAAWDAAFAARAAAWGATRATRAAAFAAGCASVDAMADRDAAWDADRDAAWAAARDQHYIWMSQVLLEILKEEK